MALFNYNFDLFIKLIMANIIIVTTPTFISNITKMGFITTNTAVTSIILVNLIANINHFITYYFHFINLNLLSFMDHRIIKNRNHLLVYYTKI